MSLVCIWVWDMMVLLVNVGVVVEVEIVMRRVVIRWVFIMYFDKMELVIKGIRFMYWVGV